MCDVSHNCEHISSSSSEAESQKEKEVPGKENATASPSSHVGKAQPFGCSDNASFSQIKPLQPLLYSWSLTNVCALSWLHIFRAEIPGEGKSHSAMW